MAAKISQLALTILQFSHFKKTHHQLCLCWLINKFIYCIAQEEAKKAYVDYVGELLAKAGKDPIA